MEIRFCEPYTWDPHSEILLKVYDGSIISLQVTIRQLQIFVQLFNNENGGGSIILAQCAERYTGSHSSCNLSKQ